MDENIKEGDMAKPKKNILEQVVKLLPYLIIAAAFSVGSFYLIKVKPDLLGLAKKTQTVESEAEKIITAVGKLMILPSDEKPTIATVTNMEKVKNQIFFKNAKNGDKVLLYEKAQKAILYRPEANIIVEVGAINIGGTPKP